VTPVSHLAHYANAIPLDAYVGDAAACRAGTPSWTCLRVLLLALNKRQPFLEVRTKQMYTCITTNAWSHGAVVIHTRQIYSQHDYCSCTREKHGHQA
jgi:hypothetical protein